ncbi:SpoIIE family protein phosphatase [Pseudomonas mediterranea]|jgi:serine/threonine-protein phosphatase Stp1|uniref:PP2C family protein-serine/threonine phosphatase n=1 Tax=Pseudomonas mediterranea TaxID=183795 RepID=UPI001316B042|nr:PP2C family serine/threonine-protein phosphatase [Pseudomonas mediterranea]MBL0845608.1 serine/threonine-protein phosphatase [Pseudomonas mediterranea]QHA85163.1 SpoIIE family protein phosphatase [Pseudomonas mediterranea]UZE00901.1 serine/threonine-protein phosphatase [Pseudomonas mediterranea]CAH0193619.1 PP2C-family Ser/Thr phosphatase [Pseudomonas mediterranea]
MHRAGTWRSAARTNPGKRRPKNEDAFLDCPQQGLWAVADGMGGYGGGDIASQLIVANLAALPLHPDLRERSKAVRQCLRWTNRRLSQELTITAAQHPAIMGSTVVALLLEGDRGTCIWAGDSRCYLWRDRQLYQLSKDHSLQQQLITQQHLSVDEASAHPAAKALTRAVGAAPELTLEVLELEVKPGDTFLLCSDGLHQDLDGQTLGHGLDLASPQMALDYLFEQVLHGSARDNLTAVVITR